MMHIHVIETGFFKLDGGAMFGIVPKSIWNRMNPADDNNLCTWSMRCLLIETDNRKILIDTGLGDKQDARFRSYFHPHGTDTLLKSIAGIGLSPADITDVLLTHLHFDHCGGAVIRTVEGNLIPAFPNATYWSTQKHWDWACEPNAREAASFLKENFIPLQEHQVIKFIPQINGIEWIPGISIYFHFGHTEAMMIPVIRTGGKTLIYCADTIPSSHHIGLPYIMSYDVRPLETLREKQELMHLALQEEAYLFFEHDPHICCTNLSRDEKGRIHNNVSFDKLPF